MQPDWFISNGSQIQGLIDTKNKLHTEMLQCDTPGTRGRFRAAQRVVAKSVRTAKEEWIENISKEAERSGHVGNAL